jgi:hypothetical protein
MRQPPPAFLLCSAAKDDRSQRHPQRQPFYRVVFLFSFRGRDVVGGSVWPTAPSHLRTADEVVRRFEVRSKLRHEKKMGQWPVHKTVRVARPIDTRVQICCECHKQDAQTKVKTAYLPEFGLANMTCLIS